MNITSVTTNYSNEQIKKSNNTVKTKSVSDTKEVSTNNKETSSKKSQNTSSKNIKKDNDGTTFPCLLYTSPSPRDM